MLNLGRDEVEGEGMNEENAPMAIVQAKNDLLEVIQRLGFG
jgi:hypothetical protein